MEKGAEPSGTVLPTAVTESLSFGRFVFFHAFFVTKKATPDVPETEAKLSAPLDDSTRAALVGGFFG